jgi:GT2 family glycosyltransferase
VEIFDEDFFSYKEDVDLAFRLRSAGWAAYVLPDVRAWHDRTAAGPRELSDAAAADLRRSKSPLVRYHSYKNHLLTLLKNEHPINLARHWPWVVGYELKKLAYVLLRERDTLRALGELRQRLPAMRAKRAQVMAKWKVPPHELRRWFK